MGEGKLELNTCMIKQKGLFCEKKKYVTEEFARQMADKAQERYLQETGKERKFQVYKCKDCGVFHITKMSNEYRKKLTKLGVNDNKASYRRELEAKHWEKKKGWKG